MRIIGVIDLREGQAVHARGGRREEYAPVATAAGVTIDGDASALARVYVETLGIRELYIADLDAIEHGIDAMRIDLIAAIAALGVPVWVDAGTSTMADARRVLAAGASVVIVGLETLPDFDALTEICTAVGGDRVAVSVDLRDGALVVPPNASHRCTSAWDAAERASAAGARRVIVLDLARVGTGARVDLALMAAVRRAVPHVELFAGGGVRDQSDLDVLAAAGVDGALAATALLRGTIHV